MVGLVRLLRISSNQAAGRRYPAFAPWPGRAKAGNAAAMLREDHWRINAVQVGAIPLIRESAELYPI